MKLPCREAPPCGWGASLAEIILPLPGGYSYLSEPLSLLPTSDLFNLANNVPLVQPGGTIRWAVLFRAAHFSPRIIPIVPKMNGAFNRREIKGEFLV
jgi:hypothetical protein